jgi:hypothetical protein
VGDLLSGYSGGYPLVLVTHVNRCPAIINRTEIIGDARAYVVPALIAAAGERASLRFLEFFTANIRNPHTRRAYSRAVGEFMAWCEDNGVTSITAVQPLHVSAWIEHQTREALAQAANKRAAELREHKRVRPSRLVRIRKKLQYGGIGSRRQTGIW